MKDTDTKLAQQMVYSVFCRNHTKEGTLAALLPDLDRIRALGTDVLWLMPIHPIGKEKRKGKHGSPYAIADYRAIHPDYGTEQDLDMLVGACHERGMQVYMDVVFNHTSPDSVLANTHPDWFYQDEAGKPCGLVKDWSDVADLDFSNEGLQDELISTLVHWAGIVDGFRCDVASRIPLAFWEKARKAVEAVHPGFVWLAESCHEPFVKFVRDCGRTGLSDGELYTVFDVLYDYDIYPFYLEYLEGKRPLRDWVSELERQESRYPANYIKLRYLENHDQPRLAGFTESEAEWENWTALLFMLKGMPLVYHGQEDGIAHQPDIFNQDVVPFVQDTKKAGFIKKLADLHKQMDPAGPIDYTVDGDGLEVARKEATGLFLLQDGQKTISTHLAAGNYINAINGKTVVVVDGTVAARYLPAIIQKGA